MMGQAIKSDDVDDNFHKSVAISADGHSVAIGTFGTGSTSSVKVFETSCTNVTDSPTSSPVSSSAPSSVHSSTPTLEPDVDSSTSSVYRQLY